MSGARERYLLTLIISAFFVISLGVWADCVWVGGISNDMWDEKNWEGALDGVLTIGAGNPHNPMQHKTRQGAKDWRPGVLNTTEQADLLINNGQLMPWGTHHLNGKVELGNGAELNIRSDVYVGRDGVGALTINGGTFRLKGGMILGDGANGNGALRVLNGYVHLNEPPKFGVNGGEGSIYIQDSGFCYTPGDTTGIFKELIHTGKIVTDPGFIVVATYNPADNNTTLNARRIAGATMPRPWNGVHTLEQPDRLSWTPGPGDVISEVYFGADANAVESAAKDNPAIFLGSTQGAVISMPAYAKLDTTCYWRVDTVRDGETTKGDLWSFTYVNKLKPRRMEYLDRGLVAIKSNDGIFLSWRLLGTEPDAIAFNVYRDGELLNHSPITDSTNYVDANGTLEATYCVRAVLDGKEQAVSREVKAWPKEHFSIPVQQVPGDDNFSYFINDGECGDLDGDGEYEIVIKRISPDPDEHMLFEAYKLDGTMMWRINMGPNYLYDAELNFLVYDLDSDGKAEMVTRTSEGTTDGAGATIGDENRDGIGDYRPFSWKFISKGPDFLSVFDGMTGRELDRADYIERNPVIQYGDNYGHRATKCMFAAVYLDGEKPSLFITRGIYALIKLEAWNFRNGKLEKLWRFNSNEWPGYSYQGNHNMSTGDVDNDGYDEIIYASMTIDQDGKGLYTTELGHGDALHVSDMDPGRPGLEVWQCHETQASGITFRDAKTGLIIFEYDNPKDVGRCCAGDIDPTHRGFELWGSTGSPMYTCKGEEIGPSSLPMNFMVWWDGDLLRELLDHHWLGGEVGAGTGQIFKWDYEQKKADVILNAEGAYSCNWTKGTPTLQADLFGDWREEVVWRSADNRELRIYSTTIPTGHRIYTLMHDPHYRENVAWQNNSYNQPPHTGFYLGDGMDAPPKPNIEVVKP